MTVFLHDLLTTAAEKYPQNLALTLKSQTLNYAQLHQLTNVTANAFSRLNLSRFERIGIYLGKTFENVACMFATSKIGAAFVPINANLKAPQVSHIINDCSVKVLVTNSARLIQLMQSTNNLASLNQVILIDDITSTKFNNAPFVIHQWSTWIEEGNSLPICPPKTSDDMAAILYTSGSTGLPKGVVLSHANLVLGAQSVTQYLKNTEQDVILAVLPFSFDYGLNQLFSSFYVGAHCVLLDYLLPRDIIRAIVKYRVTGLAAVPPLWQQLIQLNVSENDLYSLRYFTNSGGALAKSTLLKIQAMFPNALPYLMYGLTEAFRSTYLPPEQVTIRPSSIGKAIPNAEILVLRPDGTPCEVDEIGELVHCGPLVSLGYWNNVEATSKRFKPAPNVLREVPMRSLAVWSGDSAKKDEEGFLYFVSRNDEMIKSSGYRISPSEIEQCLYSINNVNGAVVFGVEDAQLGQAICAVVEMKQLESNQITEGQLLTHCQTMLPNYMVPKFCFIVDNLPCNTNGKIARSAVKKDYLELCRSAK